MDIKATKTNYPKTVRALIRFIKQGHESFVAKVNAEAGEESLSMEDFNDNFIEGIVQGALLSNPESLFHFFDTHGIKIVVMPHPEDDNLWLYYNSRNKATKSAGSRAQANDMALQAACDLLEEELNDKVKYPKYPS